MLRVYTQDAIARPWLQAHRHQRPIFVGVLGFTETALIPGISAAGATPEDRRYTAIADAEFLYHGPRPDPQFPLPPLHAGASPVLISRAVVAQQEIPIYLYDAGLASPLTVPCTALGGTPARCVSTGAALSLSVVHHLFQQAMALGTQLAQTAQPGYLIVGECVVGGTTTALAVLTALGWSAYGKVSSSHPACNHRQKQRVVEQGLKRLTAATTPLSPLEIVAGVGDPMQVVVAGLLLTASRGCGVLLAGGTQMLAVYALARAIAQQQNIPWRPEAVVVGTTRWVTEDPSGDAVGLARLLNAPLIATQLSFADSRYAQLRAYEQGFVKEGVGAGGCAIAASLYQDWGQTDLLAAIEAIAAAHEQAQPPTNSTYAARASAQYCEKPGFFVD